MHFLSKCWYKLFLFNTGQILSSCIACVFPLLKVFKQIIIGVRRWLGRLGLIWELVEVRGISIASNTWKNRRFELSCLHLGPADGTEPFVLHHITSTGAEITQTSCAIGLKQSLDKILCIWINVARELNLSSQDLLIHLQRVVALIIEWGIAIN